jgi:hypothetical protein
MTESALGNMMMQSGLVRLIIHLIILHTETNKLGSCFMVTQEGRTDLQTNPPREQKHVPSLFSKMMVSLFCILKQDGLIVYFIVTTQGQSCQRRDK